MHELEMNDVNNEKQKFLRKQILSNQQKSNHDIENKKVYAQFSNKNLNGSIAGFEPKGQGTNTSSSMKPNCPNVTMISPPPPDMNFTNEQDLFFLQQHIDMTEQQATSEQFDKK